MDNILSALNYIDAASLLYGEWVAVGMALKEEGYPCSIWDEWSRNDARYHQGECEMKWQSFRGNGKPVTGGTIIQMAKERGWKGFAGEDGCMNWDNDIENDDDRGSDRPKPSNVWNPAEELITYLETLFDPEDFVRYVTGNAYQDAKGKWRPGKGVSDRTVGELIATLQAHPDDIGATVGDWKPQAGAWITFNSLDGKDICNDNVTKFKYALVESDEIPIAEQDALYRKLELPIAALVNSGGKSLHAIVRVDARNYDEYKERVEFLYDFLKENGLPLDEQDRNPSRMSRMPGITRNGNRQYLVATNIGRKSWADWMNFVEGASDELPEMVPLSEYKDDPLSPPEELIKGILRRGHKMLISGPSKAGKSCLIMTLCIAIAEGKEWLGFQCRQGKVLYVNLEIDPRSAVCRFIDIYDAMALDMENAANIVIWNLRGHAVPLDELVPRLIRRMKGQGFDAVIIDPIYKVITGDENNASAMGAFCNQFDKICAETGCSVIYCHHHSKGAQGQKRSMDRASGSGVFARDPDALLDIIQLELTEDLKNDIGDSGVTAWRMESNLREFKNIVPVNFWFQYPIHLVDTTGELEKCKVDGSWQANLSKSSKRTSAGEREKTLDSAFNACAVDGMAKTADMAEYAGVSDRSIRNYIKEFGNYTCKNGEVRKERK